MACFTASKKIPRRFIRRRLCVSSECIQKLSDCKLRILCDRRCWCATPKLRVTKRFEALAARAPALYIFLSSSSSCARSWCSFSRRFSTRTVSYLPRGSLSAKRIIICLSFTKEYLYQASSLTKSFRLTAAEVSSTPFSTGLLASYWSSSLFFLKDGGASRCNLLISDICSAALESLDLFKSETDADTRPLIWERSWGVITRLRLTE